MSRVFPPYPWGLVIQQDVCGFDLRMYLDFPKWQFQASPSGNLSPGCLSMGQCPNSGSLLRALPKCMPYVTDAVACLSPTPKPPRGSFPASATLFCKFLSARSPHPRGAGAGGGRRQRHRWREEYPLSWSTGTHTFLYTSWLSYHWRTIQDVTFAFRESNSCPKSEDICVSLQYSSKF